MMRWKWAHGVVIGLLMVQVQAVASEAWTYEVLQPFDLAEGISVSRVTYVAYGGALSPILLTTAPNRVQFGETGEWANLNAACAAGLKVSSKSVEEFYSRGFPDTVTVALDATSLSSWRTETGWGDTTLLAATIECVVVNAAQCPQVKYVRVVVKGERKYARFSGVDRASLYRAGPVRRRFN